MPVFFGFQILKAEFLQHEPQARFLEKKGHHLGNETQLTHANQLNTKFFQLQNLTNVRNKLGHANHSNLNFNSD